VALKIVLKDVLNPSVELPFYKQWRSKITAAKAQRECQDWQDTLIAAVSIPV